MANARLARPSWRGRTNVDALTIAAIERAESIGGHEFVVTQGSYQSGNGDPKSAGTHDLGGVVDLRWCGHEKCVRALRQAGFAAWHRTPSQGDWPHHIHAVVIDHPNLAASAARQVASYRAGKNGLASNGKDDGPRVAIAAPVFPWPQGDKNQKTRRAILAAEKKGDAFVAALKTAEKEARAAGLKVVADRLAARIKSEKAYIGRLGKRRVALRPKKK